METAAMLSYLTRLFQARRTYWSVVRELSTYTDRELYDIGIDRADIHSIARVGALGRPGVSRFHAALAMGD